MQRMDLRACGRLLALSEAISPYFREPYGRDRPFSIVASDRNSQPVQFIKPNVLNRSGLSIGEGHGSTYKERASLLVRAEDRRRLWDIHVTSPYSSQTKVSERLEAMHLNLEKPGLFSMDS
jgi:hypothetical protein